VLVVVPIYYFTSVAGTLTTLPRSEKIRYEFSRFLRSMSFRTASLQPSTILFFISAFVILLSLKPIAISRHYKYGSHSLPRQATRALIGSCPKTTTYPPGFYITQKN
jgi:hypothetical protein